MSEAAQSASTLRIHQPASKNLYTCNHMHMTRIHTNGEKAPPVAPFGGSNRTLRRPDTSKLFHRCERRLVFLLSKSQGHGRDVKEEAKAKQCPHGRGCV